MTYPLVWHVNRMKSTKHVGKIPFDPQVESGCLALLSTLKIDTDFGDYLHLNLSVRKEHFCQDFHFHYRRHRHHHRFLIVCSNYTEETHHRQMWKVLGLFLSALFAFFYLLSPHTHPSHHHVILQTAHPPPDSHSWIPKHRLWLRCLWIRPGDECPDKTSAVSKE